MYEPYLHNRGKPNSGTSEQLESQHQFPSKASYVLNFTQRQQNRYSLSHGDSFSSPQRFLPCQAMRFSRAPSSHLCLVSAGGNALVALVCVALISPANCSLSSRLDCKSEILSRSRIEGRSSGHIIAW